jgi:saccharopine dehydrogenase-like NADP-dependent oxidoreductase
MEKHFNIIIAGAGGIAEAVALILAEWSAITPTLFIGDRNQLKANKVAKWVIEGCSKPCSVTDFTINETIETGEMIAVFEKGSIILDCLPGSAAPRIAHFAKKYNLHYVNLTEYVAETEEIIALSKNATTGFLLQTGLAPGYINLVAHQLFQKFCLNYKVKEVQTLEFKVGALTKNAVAPHFYGFTWSPIGVATEYVEETIVIRDFITTTLPSLSERAVIIIDGLTFEEDLTSGGAADLPYALAGKVKHLDYKTLRFPGHYDWINRQLKNGSSQTAKITALQQKMQECIPHIEEDQIVLYAAVEGKDQTGVLRRNELAKTILPQKVGNHTLRAIQITTAAPMAQAAQLLLEENLSGAILQSQIDSSKFLNGKFITRVYGKTI